MVSFSRCPREEGEGGSYIKVIGMLVGKFKLNPLDRDARGKIQIKPFRETNVGVAEDLTEP